MSQFQKKSSIHNFLYSPITLVVLGVIFLVVLYGVFDIISKHSDAVRARDTVLKKESNLEQRKMQLEAELSNLKTD